MPKHKGMENLVAKAILSESKGKRISQKFMSQDTNARGFVPALKAAGIVCDILRIPAPLGPDKQSTQARTQILKHCNFEIQADPDHPGEEVVEYGHFLKAFRQALRTSPLIASNPYVHSDAERNSKKKEIKKSDMSISEVMKAIDLNLPKYYRSTTEAFLKMKPPGGKLTLPDLARFMRSINLDLTDEMLRTLFRKYDKNNNGAIDAWEFFECFGGAISGHKDDSQTSLFMDKTVAPRQPIQMKTTNLTAEQTCELIKARLPFHFRSSTKAFLAAKGGADPRSHTIKFKDLKVFLQNMNIEVPDETIHGLFAYLDEDGSGGIHAKEFITTFGHAISGEKAENIKNSDHLSYHNTRPDNRVPIVPPKHQWTYEEVKATLGERLGMIHTSSTIAFMKAKRSNNRFMTVDDLKRILNNLNIEPPDSIIKRIYNDMDEDGDGLIECSEFLTYFGSYINGFAGSFETKPDWFYKEMSDLSAHIDKIDGLHVQGPETTVEEEIAEMRKKEQAEQVEKKLRAPEKLTKQQELRFMRKYGISPDDLNFLNSADDEGEGGGNNTNGMSVNNLEFINPSPMARPQSAGQARPRSAGASRPSPNPNVNGGGGGGGGWPTASSGGNPNIVTHSKTTVTSGSGPAWGAPSDTRERPRSASRERPRSAGSARPQSAGNARRQQQQQQPKSARNFQSAVNFANTSPAAVPDEDDDPFAALLNPMGGGVDREAKENVSGYGEGNHVFTDNTTAASPGGISDYSDGALLKELRDRKAKHDGSYRSKSAPKSRRGELDPNWKTPSSCFGGFNQGPHYKSTVAAKLKSAKKIAAMLEKQKIRAKKKAPRSTKRRGGRHDVGRESEPAMYNEMKFRF